MDVVPAVPLAPGASASLPGARLQELVSHFPGVGPSRPGSVPLGLVLRSGCGRPVQGGGTEAEDGAEAAPALLTLCADAVGDGHLHLLPARQEQVHEVHKGSERQEQRG